MARNENKRPRKSVNRIRKDTQDNEIKMGGRTHSEDEDIIRKPKRHATEFNTTTTKKPALEGEYIKKGRVVKPTPTKEKEYKDRHAPRKSEIEKEYTKELQKLRNRLKYREKQGFFVRWETLPSRKLYPTEKDIAQLKQYEVQLNENNEIYLHRDYINLAKLDALSIPTGLQPKNLLRNEEGFQTPQDKDGNFDVIEHIDDLLVGGLLRATQGVDYEDAVSEFSNGSYSALEMSKIETLSNCLNTYRKSVQSYPPSLMATYLLNHEGIITTLIQDILRESRVERVMEHGAELERYLEFH